MQVCSDEWFELSKRILKAGPFYLFALPKFFTEVA